jgi:hypothetical protein
MDTFRIMFCLFPDTKKYIKTLVGFTTISDFKKLYSFSYLNHCYLFIFLGVTAYLGIIDIEKIYLDFIFIFFLESHIILFIAYYKKLLFIKLVKFIFNILRKKK